MKKLFCIIAAASLLAIGVSAQNYETEKKVKHVSSTATTINGHFGIRVGGEIICPGDISQDGVGVDAFSVGGGIEFGAIYYAPIKAGLYIEPGLKLYYNQYSLNSDMTEVDASVRKFGMRIPVMVGYRFEIADKTGLHLFTGPEFEIGISAKEHSDGYSESLYGDDGGMNRFDLLWGIGAGVSYKHFFYAVSGSLGMLNMLSDSDAKFHENRVTFTIGYNF